MKLAEDCFHKEMSSQKTTAPFLQSLRRMILIYLVFLLRDHGYKSNCLIYGDGRALHARGKPYVKLTWNPSKFSFTASGV
jgi:hypothetical protein